MANGHGGLIATEDGGATWNADIETDDGGKRWRQVYTVPTPEPRPRQQHQLLDARTGFGASTDADVEALLRTDDAGATWAQVGSLGETCDGAKASAVGALRFADVQHAWALVQCAGAAAPFLARSDDGGAHWFKSVFPTNPADPLAALAYVEPTNGFVLTRAGALFVTNDGGAQFTLVPPATGALTAIQFITPLRGWALHRKQESRKNKSKRSEITAVPALLQGRDLSDTIITSDALITQRTFAEQVIAQNGYYFMMVKANQPRMRDDLALFFEIPAIACDNEQWDRFEKVEKVHGRIETRTVESMTGDCSFVGWPGATYLVRRTCERQVIKTGKTTRKVTYGITNLPIGEASAEMLEQLWRKHWSIESKSHHVRDVTMGQDRNHMRTGKAPEVLAALRNGLLALWRRAGWMSIADTVFPQRNSAKASRSKNSGFEWFHTRTIMGLCCPMPLSSPRTSAPCGMIAPSITRSASLFAPIRSTAS